MYIIDLLKRTNTEDIVKEITKIPFFFDDIDMNITISEMEKDFIKIKIVEKYTKAIERLKESNPKKNCNKVVFMIPDITDTSHLSVLMLKLTQKKKIKNTLRHKENFSNPFYGIDFMDRMEVIGLKYSNVSVNTYGTEKFLANVIYEICRFGIDEEQNESRRNEIINELQEAIDNLDESTCISSEELRSFLNIEDNRTPKEKREYELKIRREMKVGIKLYINNAKKVFKEFDR